MHLADTFIQSDLQCIQTIHLFLSVFLFGTRKVPALEFSEALFIITCVFLNWRLVLGGHRLF